MGLSWTSLCDNFPTTVVFNYNSVFSGAVNILTFLKILFGDHVFLELYIQGFDVWLFKRGQCGCWAGLNCS